MSSSVASNDADVTSLESHLHSASLHSNSDGDDSKYSFKATGKLWQITGEMSRQLLASGEWKQVPSSTSSSAGDPLYHLLLADRGRVQFQHLMGRKAPRVLMDHSTPHHHHHDASTRVMVNCFRGCNELTNKSALIKTMRHFAQHHHLNADITLDYLPKTFVLRPGASTDAATTHPTSAASAVDSSASNSLVMTISDEPAADERKLFLQEYERVQKKLADSQASAAAASSTSNERNAWIVKANRGAKGSAIFVSDEADKLIAYVDAKVNEKPEADAEGATNAPVAVTPATVAIPATDAPTTAKSGHAKSLSLASRAPPLRSRFALHARNSTSSSSSLAVAASNSWVVQRYITHPFLIQGRKFDMRMWVLLDKDYQPYLYRNGVCRTSSTPFNLSNLSDIYVHLTNHCIQTAHPDYDKNEKGNELFMPAFQSYLDSLPLGPQTGNQRLCVLCHLYPQFHRIILDTLGSVYDSMHLSGEYNGFQLFGYDFMLDENFQVKLLEINSTPASAEALLQQLVKHMKERVIDTVYAPKAHATSSAAATGAASSSSRPSSAHAKKGLATYKPPATSPAAVLQHHCNCASKLSAAGVTSKQDYLSPPFECNLFDPIVS